MNFYKGLPATLYDSFFSEVDEQELNYYAQHIAACPQPALEVGCGTGRLLLPLLERGFNVEGFDVSPDMLAMCKEKAAQRNLAPVLYEQAMQDLDVQKRYGCIFSALGTFQQISNRADAQRALQKLYDHMLPGGRLIVYLYLPWHDAPPFGEWHEHETIVVHNKKIVVREKSIHDPLEQLIFSTYCYEVFENSMCIEQEEHELTLRWYSRYEFQMMLAQAGFKNSIVSAGYDDNGPFDVMLFCAMK